MNAAAFLGSLAAVAVALVLVLGLAWLAIKGLKHWQDRVRASGEESGRPMRFLRAMPLGQNERVALIEVEGETMLVGVTPGGISLLARWPADSESAAP